MKNIFCSHLFLCMGKEHYCRGQANNHYGISQFIFVSLSSPKNERERPPAGQTLSEHRKKTYLLIFSFFVQLVDIRRECLCISNVNKVRSFFDKYFLPTTTNVCQSNTDIQCQQRSLQFMLVSISKKTFQRLKTSSKFFFLNKSFNH